jgi:hypothetical protein
MYKQIHNEHVFYQRNVRPESSPLDPQPKTARPALVTLTVSYTSARDQPQVPTPKRPYLSPSSESSAPSRGLPRRVLSQQAASIT